MTKKERIEAVIRGDMTDRIPFTFWKEPSATNRDPEIRGQETLDFYHTYSVDLLKTMNPARYSAEAFGALFDEEGKKIVGSPIRNGEDWKNLKPVTVNDGILLREQNYVKYILDHTKGEVPVLFTVISPFTTAFMLDPHLLDHIREGKGEWVKKGLKSITETTCALVQQIIRLGADGIFLEADMASYDLMDEKTIGNTACPTIWLSFPHPLAGATWSTDAAGILCSRSFGNTRQKSSAGRLMKVFPPWNSPLS